GDRPLEIGAKTNEKINESFAKDQKNTNGSKRNKKRDRGMKTAAVIIGHDKFSPGAYSKYLHASEYMYNSEVASYLGGIADVYKRPLGGGYTTQMRQIAEILNPKNYDLVVELHFNSFKNSSANGCEAIVYPGN